MKGYKIIRIKKIIHHRFKVVCTEAEVNMEILATAIFENALASKELMKELINEIKNKRT